MGRCIQFLCRHGLGADKKGIQWLVGSLSMPFTVVSILHCLHFVGNTGDPDFVAESDDLRILLPKGLEVVGAVVNEANDLETVRKAGEFALKLIDCLWPDFDKSTGVIAANLVPGGSSCKYYFYMPHKDAKLEAFDNIIYKEEPGAYIWMNMTLLRCQMQLKVPLYAESFAKPSDYETQLSKAVENVVDDLRSSRLFCYIEGLAGHSRKSVQMLLKPVTGKQPNDVSSTRAIYLGGLEEGRQSETILCSDFSSSDSLTSSHGVQMPMPLKLTLMLHQSMSNGKVSAPFAEYLPASGGAAVRVMSLNLDAVCLAPRQLCLSQAVASLVIPALIDQLVAMKMTVLKEFVEQPKLCTYHFCPPGFVHPISSIYDVSFGESELRIVEARRTLHCRLGLPMDRPLLRIANALAFVGTRNAVDGNTRGGLRLCNVHVGVPSSGVVGGHASIIEGSYEYYHYLQDSMNDTGWGCAYRSLQTIVSWFRLQHYTAADFLTHRKIQEILVEIGDKEPSFIGSQEWIGAIELSFVLDQLLGVTSKILNVRSGAELPEKCRELALHFETQGTPVMIGGGVLAYTLLGVDYNEATGDSAFLILDPHYTGGEDLKSIWSGGWCGWKKAVSSKGEEFFLRNKFYNLLLPQRPNTV